MFNHVMVGSNDIERSKRFYDAVLAVLGSINGEPACHANGGTIGFKCESAEQVKTFHDVAVAHGGQSIEEPPGLRDGSLGPMHLAYVRDPDGNKLCAVYRMPKA
jgi:catechol 2,3-dioxygenase-like lactoylglutathione lyase family enzyme